MNRAGPVINLASLLFCVWAGYRSLDTDALRGTNPNGYLALAVLILMPVFVLGAIWFSGARTLRRPSWRRFSINWWGDPLQCLFLSTWFIGAGTLGAALHLLHTSRAGFWNFMTCLCILIGLILGQVIAYAIFHRRISRA
jgi:hypothetical protein